jgi:Domain of Unknown Function (DUF1080)
MKTRILKNTGIFLLMIALGSCAGSTGKKTSTDESAKPASAVALETPASVPVPIFDGSGLNGWHGFNKTGEVKNWKIEDSALVCLGASKDASGGDLVSDKEYENFDLSWQWKVSKGANSGVIYHVIESPKYKTTYETGPEYQMIDDIGFPEKLEDWQKAGADYAMNPANDRKKLMPVGEWNSSRIVFNKGHVEHWLNGEKIVTFQAWDDKWNKEKTEGKWKDYPDYGMAKKGHIALQDHGNKVYFKNIRITGL